MKFAIQTSGKQALRDRIAQAVIAEFKRRGHELAPMEEKVKFVLNLTDLTSPEAFQRKSQAEYVVSLVAADPPGGDLRTRCYRTLVKTLSNVLMCLEPKPSSDVPETYFITPETGFYHYPFDAAKVYENLLPIVGSHLVIRNRIATDLPKAYWSGTPAVEDLKRYGRELDTLGVLPAPFPLNEVLAPEDIKQLYQLFEMKGLSYGNLSVRDKVPELGSSTFWMTARGVNKAKLKGVGQDIMLVTGYDEESGRILISVPPEHNPDVRVSVDAIEHTLIYGRYPGIGAIVHVHAWMEGIPYTKQNNPCGTRELAEGAVELLDHTDDPDRTVIGLKNHGITITGPNFEDIFSRIRGQLKTTVPMME